MPNLSDNGVGAGTILDFESVRKRFFSAREAGEAAWLIGTLTLFVATLGALSSTVRTAFFGTGTLGFLPVTVLWFVGWVLVSAALVATYFYFPRLTSSARSSLSMFVFSGLGFGLTIYFSRITESPLIVEPINRWQLGAIGSSLVPLLCIVAAMLTVLGHKSFVVFAKRLSASKIYSFSLGFLLLSAYSFIAGFVLPNGVNRNFVEDVWPILFSIAVLVFAVARVGSPDCRDLASGGVRFTWRTSDLLYIALPLIPIVRYVILNFEYLTVVDLGVLVLVPLGLVVVLVVVIPTALKKIGNRDILLAFTSAGLFVFFNMASLSQSRSWSGDGSLIDQLGLLLAVIAVVVVLSQIRREVLGVAVVIFGILELGAVFLQTTEEDSFGATGQPAAEHPAWVDPLTRSSWESTPNIYLLIYESYANDETMRAYGIDNSGQMDFLLASGFTIYDGTYSLGAESLETMSRVLAMSQVLKHHPRLITSGTSPVTSILANKGYETYGFFASDYFFRGFLPGYSFSFPSLQDDLPSSPSLLEPVLRGEFRFDDSFVATDYETYLTQKRGVLGQSDAAPRFMYSHNSYPGHSQNSGQCLEGDRKNYFSGVDIANEEMREDLGSIPDLEGAIIIIAGDHGPYLTKNCRGLGLYPIDEIERLDIQDRYGTFLAVRWPGTDRRNFDIEVLQDIFPAVLSYLAGEDDFVANSRVSSETTGFLAGPVRVRDGLIFGGKDDGKTLFEMRGARESQ